MKAFVDKLIAWGPQGLFLLAFLDGLGVPLPGGVDSLLVLLCATNPAQAYFYALVTLVASMSGGIILFLLARKGGERLMNQYTATGRGARFKLWFLQYGLITVFVPAFVIIPMPLKVFVICAGAMGVPLRAYVLTLLLARVPRFFGLAWLGATYGHDAWPWLKSHGWYMGGFAVVLFTGIYLVLRSISHPEPDPAQSA
jgi:membrane protein YqaA with SNARE-associated domain